MRVYRLACKTQPSDGAFRFGHSCRGGRHNPEPQDDPGLEVNVWQYRGVLYCGTHDMERLYYWFYDAGNWIADACQIYVYEVADHWVRCGTYQVLFPLDKATLIETLPFEAML